MPFEETPNLRTSSAVPPAADSVKRQVPPERWRRDYDTDSGLALADATSLRGKLAWSERAMG